MTAVNPRTCFIAFYSYKGGVGRTLALANCARALAAGGRRVAVLDLDLEAPGLEHFDTLRPRDEPRRRGADRRPPLSGFAEYIAACRDAGPPEHLADYCHRCAGLPDDKDDGEVWLMPAGRRGSPAYQAVLALDWERFYREEDGYRLVENLRGHLVEELKPDYVLLDARTGLTELGGIATHQLADLVVLLFNLNRQNIEGIRWVHDSLRRVPRSPRLLLAASPIPAMPAGKGSPFEERMRYVRTHLTSARNADRPIVIPYQPVLAWEERILVDSRDDPFDYDVPYRRLLKLILETLDAPEVYLDRAMREWRDDEVKSALETLDQGVAANPDAPEVWRAKFDFLLAEEAKTNSPAARFQIRQQLEEARTRLADLGFSSQLGGPVVDLSRLPAGAPDFCGRGPELAFLDTAWSGDDAAADVHIVVLVAPGGVGKTALVKRWLDQLKADGWRGAAQVFGWSFHSQGADDDRQPTEDRFLGEALAWLAIEHDPAASSREQGRLLAGAVAARRTLLVLDGLEPLQYPPGPLAGQLRAPGLKALLTRLAGSGQPGLTILTSREPLADLAEYERSPAYPQGSVLTRNLGNLSDNDGAQLLHRLGCVRAGAAAIGSQDAELCAATREVRGHALTLNLLGRYLAQAEQGNIRRRDTVNLMDAADSQGGHVARVLATYETWFARVGRTVELAVLRLFGLFDRPADAGCLQVLRQAPPITGLTEPLMDLTQARWNLALSRLVECGLIEQPGRAGALDAHPLVREYLGRRLRATDPDAWREGHRRLYDYLKASVPHRPDGLAGLQALYQAVMHGCLAGLQQEAWDQVYRDRILRGTGDDGFYSTKILGAFGADLGAVACFFDEPWGRVSATLTEPDQNGLLNLAAVDLRALGRLSEALEPMRAGLDGAVRLEDWENAAIRAGNLCELDLTLGLVSDALADAGRSVEYADRSGDASQRMGGRAALADALHQQGERGLALGRFREAESIQAGSQPQYPLLYSLPGYQYCDLLLAEPERAAWRGLLARPVADVRLGSVGPALSAETVDWAAEERLTNLPAEPGAPLGIVFWPNLRAQCESVAGRAVQALERVKSQRRLLDTALDHLTLGRVALFLALLDPAGPTRPALDRAARELADALEGLRAAGQQQYVPLGLLHRALLHTLLQSPAAARTDLDESWMIASRGGMVLLMADCRLHRARLFKDRAELAGARTLIDQCGYGRRREELTDAERAATAWGNDQAGAPTVIP